MLESGHFSVTLNAARSERFALFEYGVLLRELVISSLQNQNHVDLLEVQKRATMLEGMTVSRALQCNTVGTFLTHTQKKNISGVFDNVYHSILCGWSTSTSPSSPFSATRPTCHVSFTSSLVNSLRITSPGSIPLLNPFDSLPSSSSPNMAPLL